MKQPSEVKNNESKAFDPERPEKNESLKPLKPPQKAKAIDPEPAQSDEDYNDKQGKTEIWQSYQSP